MSDVRGKWPGKELVGMNFVGSAKAGREGEASRAKQGAPGRRATSLGAERPRGAARGRGPPVASGRRSGVATRAPPPRPRPRPAPVAWHSSKRAPDCYALCFLLRAEPGGMGLAQAVSSPRGGGTLKGQRPLPAAAAAAAARPRRPHLPAAGWTPFREATGGASRARGQRAPAETAQEVAQSQGARGTCRGSLAGRRAGFEPRSGGWGSPGPLPGTGQGWCGESREKARGRGRRRWRDWQGLTGCQALTHRTSLHFEFSQRFREVEAFPFYRWKNTMGWQVASDRVVKLGFQLVCPSQVLNVEPVARGTGDISG